MKKLFLIILVSIICARSFSQVLTAKQKDSLNKIYHTLNFNGNRVMVPGTIYCTEDPKVVKATRHGNDWPIDGFQVFEYAYNVKTKEVVLLQKEGGTDDEKWSYKVAAKDKNGKPILLPSGKPAYINIPRQIVGKCDISKNRFIPK